MKNLPADVECIIYYCVPRGLVRTSTLEIQPGKLVRQLEGQCFAFMKHRGLNVQKLHTCGATH
jgi:hypothetical protein